MFDYIKEKYQEYRSSTQNTASMAANYFPVMILALALMMIMFFLLSGRGQESALSLNLAEDNKKGTTSNTDQIGKKGKAGNTGTGLGKDSGSAKSSSDADTVGSQKFLYVHIAGAVANPGLYKIQVGSRVNDGVVVAGDLQASADPDAVNLADLLVDGQKIYIPFKGTALPEATGSNVGSSVGISQSSNGSTSPNAYQPGGAIGGNGTAAVNVNSASAVELDTLPGIGPVMAEKIITYREENGPFKSLEELKNVSGIGDKKYADLIQNLTI